MWLTKLKIAIVEKDPDRLNELMDSIPQLESQQEMQEAFYLIQEAKRLVLGLQEETSASIRQIQKNKNFLKSTTAPQDNKLDITS